VLNKIRVSCLLFARAFHWVFYALIIFLLINVQLRVAQSTEQSIFMIYVIITFINIQDMRRMIDAYLLPCPAHIAHTPGIALLMRTL